MRRSPQSPSARRVRRAAVDAYRPALVPERPQAIVTSFGAESRERRSSGGAVRGRRCLRGRDPRAPSRSRRRRCRARRAAVTRDRPATLPRLHRGRRHAAASVRPRARAAIGVLAGRAEGLQVDPRDPGDSELEARGSPGAGVSGERPTHASRRIHHRLVVDPGEEPARRRKIDRIAIAPVAFEEHVRGAGRAGEKAGLVRSRSRRNCVAAGACRLRSTAAAAQRPHVRRLGTSGRQCGRRTRRGQARCPPGPCRPRSTPWARPGRQSSATSTPSPGTTGLLPARPASACRRAQPARKRDSCVTSYSVQR